MKNLDSAKRSYLFGSVENSFLNFVLPKVPSFIHANFLTLCTAIWSVLLLICGLFARDNHLWLWLISLLVVLQYITDMLDGALGRIRKSGFIQWGYFMDHLLDYVFVSMLFICYEIIFPQYILFTSLIYVVFVGYMTVSLLLFPFASEFTYSHYNIGPSEAKVFFIIFNTCLAIFGDKFISSLLPLFIIGFCISIIVLCIQLSRLQKVLWQLDLGLKNSPKAKNLIRNHKALFTRMQKL